MDMKISGILELLTIPLTLLKVSIFMPLPVAFVDLQMSKIECVNYARILKFSHKCSL